MADMRAAIESRLGPTSRPVRLGRWLYGRWLWAVFSRRGLAWSFNGEPIRIDPGVRHLAPRAAEPDLFQFLRANLRPGHVVFDVGAFLGVYAVCEARWVGPAGRVAAFEPTPASAALARRHAELNGLPAPRVTVVEVALAAATGRRMLARFAEPYRNTLEPGPLEGASTAPVRAITLDEACAELDLQPDWIRMDVQGAEFDVLRGGRETLRRGRGRLRIVAEMHPSSWAGYGVAPDRAAEVLAGFGLHARPLVPGQDPFGPDAHVELAWIEP